jgi:hypothetical protein
MACLAFINLIFMDPCFVDDSTEIPTRCSFVIEFITPKFTEGSNQISHSASTIAGHHMGI